eukprot:2527101-Amphidinium_carterae.1
MVKSEHTEKEVDSTSSTSESQRHVANSHSSNGAATSSSLLEADMPSICSAVYEAQTPQTHALTCHWGRCASVYRRAYHIVCHYPPETEGCMLKQASFF